MKKELDELIDAGVIDWETGNKIRQYYKDKKSSHPNRLLIIIGVLGAILVSLGVILILAHNWDRLNSTIKTCLAFIPLIVSQCASAYAKRYKNDSRLWKESCAVFLFFSIAAAIALVGQIYNLPGHERQFLLTWLVLGLPIIYVMPSSSVSLFIWLGILGLHTSNGPGWHTSTVSFIPYDQLIMILLLLPHYIHLIRAKPNSLYTGWHHWVIAIVISFLVFAKAFDLWHLSTMMIFCVSSLLFGIGKLGYFHKRSLRWNPYLLFGTISTVITLFVVSFRGFWTSLHSTNKLGNLNLYMDVTIFIIPLAALFFLYKYVRSYDAKDISPIPFVAIAYLMTPFLLASPYSQFHWIASNLILIIIGIYYLKQGHSKDNLTILNFGLVILALQILFRFFELDVSFVFRGLCFVVIGLIFFGINYHMLRKTKQEKS